jgi:hypothetical protein
MSILKDIIQGIRPQNNICYFDPAQAMICKFAQTLLMSIDTQDREAILLAFNQFYRHSKTPLSKA